MVSINAKLKERLTRGVKKYQPILAKAKAADINESDTVTIITDMLSDIFGWDKYDNITSEFAIKKTYCDLAIKLDSKVCLLIECKAAGLDLKDDHIRQATNYAADSGIDWVALTNGSLWKIYKILFTKPVEKALVYEFDFLQLNTKKQSDIDMLYYLCIDAFSKVSKVTLDDLHTQKQIINRYTVGQIIMSDQAVDSLRKTIRKLYPEVRVDSEELLGLIKNEILKRDVIEGDNADEAKKKVLKAGKAVAPTRTKKQNNAAEVITE